MTASSLPQPRTTNVLKNLFVSYAAQIVTLILSLAPIAFAPNYLGATGMGQLTLAVSFTAIFSTLMAMGTSNYLIREIASEHRQLSELVWSAVTLRVLLALALLPGALIVLVALRYSAETQRVVALMYVAVTVRMISYTFDEALVALERLVWRSAATVLYEIVAVGAGWLVLAQGGGIIGYVLIVALAEFVQLVLNLGRLTWRHRLRLHIRWATIKQIFWGGIPFLLWVLLQQTYTQAGSLLLSMLGSEEAVGWFGTAMQFTVPLFAVPTVAVTVLLPRFSNMYQVDRIVFRQAVIRALQYMVIITVPLAFGLASIANRVIGLFNYPATFQHSVPVLALSALTLPITSVLMVTGISAAAQKAERTWSQVPLFSLVWIVVLNVVLVPLSAQYFANAAIGAALANLGAEGLTLIFAIWLFGKRSMDWSVARTTSKAMLASLVMIGAVVVTWSLPLAVPIMAGALAYLGCAWLLRLIPSDDVAALYRVMTARWWAMRQPKLSQTQES